MVARADQVAGQQEAEELPPAVRQQPYPHRPAAYQQARLGDLTFTIIDTAGLEGAGPESLAGRMMQQTKKAIEQADAVFFMLDAKTGPVPDDRAFADLVRRSGKPVIVVANKAEASAYITADLHDGFDHRGLARALLRQWRAAGPMLDYLARFPDEYALIDPR